MMRCGKSCAGFSKTTLVPVIDFSGNGVAGRAPGMAGETSEPSFVFSMRRNSNDAPPFALKSRCMPVMTEPLAEVQCSSPPASSRHDPVMNDGRSAAAAESETKSSAISVIFLMSVSVRIGRASRLEISDKGVVHGVPLAEKLGRRDAGELAEFVDGVRLVVVRERLLALQRGVKARQSAELLRTDSDDVV